MNLPKLLGLVLFLSCFIILNGCEDGATDPVVCTEEFVTIALTVENPDGEPVENVDITVTNTETGEELQVCETDVYECGNGTGGNYVIFHDGLMDKVSMDGESFEVSGEKDGASFSENFEFAKDECHVLKVSGPDAVVID